ncbi:type IV secretory system conjugative DNA transfer family protein [Streptococcus dentasini]
MSSIRLLFDGLLNFAFSSWLNSLLSLTGIGYLAYKGYGHYKQPVIRFAKQIGDWMKHPQALKKQLSPKRIRQELKRKGPKEVGRLIVWPLAWLLLLGLNGFVRLAYRIFQFFYHTFSKDGREAKRFEREMKPFLRFRTYRSFGAMGLAFSLIALLLTNYLVSVIRAINHFLYQSVTSHLTLITFNWSSILIRRLFYFEAFKIAPVLALPLFGMGLSIAWRSAWVNFEQYRDYNNNEKGNDRFATIREVKRQYKAISNKTKTYPGNGGFPVMHLKKASLPGITLGSQMLWQNRTVSRWLSDCQRFLNNFATPSGTYYIDDGTVNALSAGMTRSGKGEGWITTTIEMNSRAEVQPSLIMGDPKGEHYQSEYETLRKRNYDVEVLSYLNIDYSMAYQPLQLAIEAAKKGYYEKTQSYINAAAEAIYRHTKSGIGNGNAKYFEDSSIALFTAVAMALLDRAHETVQNGEEDAWLTITIRNIAKFMINLGSETVYEDPDGNLIDHPTQDMIVERCSKITAYFNNLQRVNQVQYSKFREQAILAFASSNFAAGETQGNIYSSMMSGINLYLQDNIAKLTSMNSVELASFGFPRRLSIFFKSSTNKELANSYAFQKAQVTIKGTNHFLGLTKETIYVDHQAADVDGYGYLNMVIEPKLPNHFTIEVAFEDETFEIAAEKVYRCHEGTKRYILDEYTKKPILDTIALSIVSQPDGGLLEPSDIELVYSDKPKAIFLVTPPNKKEYNALVTLFLDQLFNVNAELAGTAPGRKCVNRITYILDEFTNLPAIPAMDTKISINLGLNIVFYLWVQNFEQLDKEYGEKVAQTIKDNCSIQVYIKSKGKTTEYFSRESGNKTITVRNRSSNILGDEANPNVTVNQEKQELLDKSQLSKLQEGEALILRGVKARDNHGFKIITYPIFLTGKTAMPMRYMFLQDEFDQSKSFFDIPVDSPHRYLNLQDIAVPADQALDNLISWRMLLTNPMRQGEAPKLAPRKRPLTKTQYNTYEEQLSAHVAEVLGGEDFSSAEDPNFEDDWDLEDMSDVL